MSKNSFQNRLLSRVRSEPYWVLILLFWVAAAVAFIRQLTTGVYPPRAAFNIGFLNLDVYWYGILITGGIALGAWVVSGLAMRRARAIWLKTVPALTRRIPATRLELPSEVPPILAKNNVVTLGDLLLIWGMDPRMTGLSRSGQKIVQEMLEGRSDVDKTWLENAPWRHWNPDHVWGGVAWCIILAVIGARLYHVLTPPPSMAAVGINSPLDYFRNPLQLINVRAGGLGIYGGIAGGALGLFIYTRRQRISALQWADLGVVGLALGQALGRWGNFINQELYGAPSTGPLAIFIEPRYRPDGYLDQATFHPAFLYESLWNFGAFLVLYVLARRYFHRVRSGELTALYLAMYGGGRILTETIRLDSPTIHIGTTDTGMPIAMGLSILLVLLSIGWIIWQRRRASM